MRTQIVVMFAGLALAMAPAAAASQKIGYVDSRRLIREAPGAQEAQTLIQGEMARFDAQVQVLRDSLQAMVADYERKSVLLSPDEKQKQQSALIQRQQALQQRAGSIELQATARQEELMKPVMDKVQKAIEDVRKAGGYAIIFDAASGGMVAADSTLDLTAQVIERVKASANDGGDLSPASGSVRRSPRNPPKKP
ncbi:MAG: OmpH family outer membrane protein [Longimicrobiales bacterium]